ncbi:MAG: hypothetical protein HYX69_09965 [Planctomycetia bacterium]|nr:hypothetical protein [Planctomycetia bacterium]
MWLQRLVGPDYFRSIVHIDVSADPAAADALFVGGTLGTAEPASVPLRDDDLAALAALKHLKYLDLSRTTITDAGLRQLKRLARLRHLRLVGTAVTDAGVQDFQHAVPGCTIDR